MFAFLLAIYDYCSRRGWHGAVILLTACSLLLIRFGFLSSFMLALVIYFGCLTLIFDVAVRRFLFDRDRLGPATALLAAMVVWQVAGSILREPYDLGTLSIFWHGCGVTMLLPVFAAALHYDPGFLRRCLIALFAVGSLAALVSLVRHGLLASQEERWLDVFLARRLVPIGRANHEILGAGGLVSTLFAGLALWKEASPRLRGMMIVGLGTILLAVTLTQSRGPIAALCLAVVATVLTLKIQHPGQRTATALFLAIVCALVPVGLVVGEPWLQSLLCGSEIGLCRTSARRDVWGTVLARIPERPWLGFGPRFRFPEGTYHAHNGFLGSAFFFGIPPAILLIVLVVLALVQTLRAPAPARTYSLLGIFFGIAFISTDLPNPFAFINTHYLFLWFPIVIGLVLGCRPFEPSSRKDGPVLNARTIRTGMAHERSGRK